MQSTDRKIGGFCVDICIGIYATVYARALSVGVEVMLTQYQGPCLGCRDWLGVLGKSRLKATAKASCFGCHFP